MTAPPRCVETPGCIKSIGHGALCIVPRPVTVTPVSIRSLLWACMGHPLTAALGLGLLALLWVMGWL